MGETTIPYLNGWLWRCNRARSSVFHTVWPTELRWLMKHSRGSVWSTRSGTEFCLTQRGLRWPIALYVFSTLLTFKTGKVDFILLNIDPMVFSTRGQVRRLFETRSLFILFTCSNGQDRGMRQFQPNGPPTLAVVHWSNAIHLWGLSSNGESFKKDIGELIRQREDRPPMPASLLRPACELP